MTKDEFNGLAERVFLTLIARQSDAFCRREYANEAVLLADDFVGKLAARHRALAMQNKTLIPEEILLLMEQPHPKVIECIKLVRERTGLDLKAAKDLVDKARREMGQLP